MRAASLSWIFFFCALSASAEIIQPLPKSILEPDESRLGLAGSYFQTSKNFDVNGNRSPLPGNNNFQSLKGTIFFQYGVSPDITLYSDLELVSNTASGTSLITGNGIWHTRRGLGDADLGLRYRANETPIRFYLDAAVQVPFYSRISADSWARFDETSGLPSGDGVTEFKGFLTAEAPLQTDLYLGLGLGYTLRNYGFSNFLPYTAYLKYEQTHKFFARFGVSGQATAGQDSFTGATPNDRSPNVLAGSTAFNSINPSFLKLDGLTGLYLYDAVFVTAGIQYPIFAKNTPVEPLFIAAFGMNLGGHKAHETEYQHSNRGFQEYYFPSHVVQVNNVLKMVLIDKGKGDGVRIGELMDIFEPDTTEGNPGRALGRGKVIEVGPTRSKLEILEFFSKEEVQLQEGFVVRRPVH